MFRKKDEFLRFDCDWLFAEREKIVDRLETLAPSSTQIEAGGKMTMRKESTEERKEYNRLRKELSELEQAMETKGCKAPADLTEGAEGRSKYKMP